jgi:hypothetical protein
MSVSTSSVENPRLTVREAPISIGSIDGSELVGATRVILRFAFRPEKVWFCFLVSGTTLYG